VFGRPAAEQLLHHRPFEVTRLVATGLEHRDLPVHVIESSRYFSLLGNGWAGNDSIAHLSEANLRIGLPGCAAALLAATGSGIPSPDVSPRRRF
jgi:hypothetical protein